MYIISINNICKSTSGMTVDCVLPQDEDILFNIISE
jgi:hypothetical protein